MLNRKVKNIQGAIPAPLNIYITFIYEFHEMYLSSFKFLQFSNQMRFLKDISKMPT